MKTVEPMMTERTQRGNYSIAVIHDDDSEWLNLLRLAVESLESSLGCLGLVEFTEILPIAQFQRPTIVVCWSRRERSVHTGAFRARVADALDRDLLIVPIVQDANCAASHLPAGLGDINALLWESGAGNCARTLLQFVGILDRQRSVFISHFRSDSMEAAETLRDELQKRRFRAFIDRFDLEPAVAVQAELDERMSDYAYVVLLETSGAHRSDWVRHEVSYALVHHLGLAIVQWPDVTTPIAYTSTVERYSLSSTDVAAGAVGSTLTRQAISDLIEYIEEDHARQTASRHHVLLGSVVESARSSGFEISFLPHRRVRLHRDGKADCTVGTVPRRPAIEDIFDLSQAAGDTHGVLVHPSPETIDRRAQLISWACAGRNLQAVTQTHFPASLKDRTP